MKWKNSLFLSRAQQRSYYNLVLARTYTPQSMSQLYHTAEWLWQTLLARSHETTSCVLRKCTASGASSSSSFLCKTCHFTALSVSDFFSHLSSEEHKRKVNSSLIISLACLLDWFCISLLFSLSNYLRVLNRRFLLSSLFPTTTRTVTRNQWQRQVLKDKNLFSQSKHYVSKILISFF